MKFSLLLPVTALLGFVAAQNSTATNGLGSTPFQRHVINQTQALSVINAAARQAANISSPSNIAVTDPSGFLVAFLRTDNAFLGSIDVATKKARTVSLFNGRRTSAVFYDLVQPGGPIYGIENTNGGLVVFGGGLPIYVGGFFVGAVGVSGGSTDQDVSVATAGVNAVGRTTGS